MLSVLLALSLLCPALAVESRSEAETAAAQLVELGVYQGNESGDLMLDKGLTRAELATLLARLDDPSGEFASHPQGFAYLCMFADVPDWAKPQVGYTWNRGLVKGYDTGLYGAADMVTPDAACTVILRLYGHKADEGDAWSYATAADFAVGLGWIDQTAAQGETIGRGEMAVLICRAMGQSGAETETPISTPTEDYSQQANPAVFTGYLTRGVYNAIRDTVENRDAILAGKRQAIVLNAIGESKLGEQAARIISRTPRYTLTVVEGGQMSCAVRDTENYASAVQHTQGFVDSLAGMTEREKAKSIAWYVADRITYEVKYPSPGEVLSQDGQIPGCCMAYAYSFQFLCNRAGIPCILKRGGDHQWNAVYVDGKWWDVDVSSLDAGDETRQRSYATVLNDASEMQGADFVDASPEITAFAKELLVPGSTK